MTVAELEADMILRIRAAQSLRRQTDLLLLCAIEEIAEALAEWVLSPEALSRVAAVRRSIEADFARAEEQRATDPVRVREEEEP